MGKQSVREKKTLLTFPSDGKTLAVKKKVASRKNKLNTPKGYGRKCSARNKQKAKVNTNKKTVGADKKCVNKV